ncbi:rolling circle replication-associated protein, partial [Methanococcus voltae]
NCDSTSATLQKSNNNNKFTGFNDKRNWTFKKAHQIVTDNNYLDITNDEHKKSRYDLNFFFVENVRDALEKKLILKLKEDFKFLDVTKFKILPFKTRFTDVNRINANLRDFNKKFDAMSNRHDKAVFLTLTSDPSLFDSIQEMADNLHKNYKKIFDRIQKRFIRKTNRKLEYIYSFEFSPKKALPHLHVVIFGTDFLDLRDYRKNAKNWTEQETTKTVFKLSEWWQSYGQGRTVYIYGIKRTLDKKTKNYKWVYKNPNNKPKDSTKNDVKHYIKKYLIKSFYSMKRILGILEDIKRNASPTNNFNARKGEIYKSVGQLPFYYATNKKFWNSSRCPDEDEDPQQQDIQLEKIGIYEPMMACYSSAVPQFVYEAIHNDIQNSKRRRGGFGSMGLSTPLIDYS